MAQYNKKALVIFDLDPKITQEQLMAVFSSKGCNPKNVRIIASKKGRNNLRTAIAKFHTAADASRGKKSVNHTVIGKTDVFISYAPVKGNSISSVFSSDNCVVFKKAPTELAVNSLLTQFKTIFNGVNDVKLFKKPTGQTYGNGIIIFKNKMFANSALIHVGPIVFTIDKRRVSANVKFKKNEISSDDDSSSDDDHVGGDMGIARNDHFIDENIVYIKWFPSRWTKSDLKTFAMKSGNISNIDLKYNKEHNENFAIITFKDARGASKFKKLSNREIFKATKKPVIGAYGVDKKVFVPYIETFMPKDIRKTVLNDKVANGCCISVSNFQSNIDERDINAEFFQFGMIFSTLLMDMKGIKKTRKSGKKTNLKTALITFNNPASALRALSLNNAKLINAKKTGNPIIVTSYPNKETKLTTVPSRGNKEDIKVEDLFSYEEEHSYIPSNYPEELIRSKFPKFFDRASTMRAPVQNNQKTCIVVDATEFVRKYSVDHCFVSIMTLLYSLWEINTQNIDMTVVGSRVKKIFTNRDCDSIIGDKSLYIEIYNSIRELASNSRKIVSAINDIIAKLQRMKGTRVIFVLSDCIFDNRQETEARNMIYNANREEIYVMNIGTGPMPYKVTNHSNLSIYSKNMEEIHNSTRKISEIIYQQEKDNFQRGIASATKVAKDQVKRTSAVDNVNSMVNDIAISKNVILNSSSLSNRTDIDPNYDLARNNGFSDYKILLMFFYEGNATDPRNPDRHITSDVFERGYSGMPSGVRPPGTLLRSKGFKYTIVKTYEQSVRELRTCSYSIAVICTASSGYRKFSNSDQEYFECFLNAIAEFRRNGGALVMFGENRPFTFEINHILSKLSSKLESPGIISKDDIFSLRFNTTQEDDIGGEHMRIGNGSTGTFKDPSIIEYDYIDGRKCSIYPFGTGLRKLYEGKTLAIPQYNYGDFKEFARTNKGTPILYNIPNDSQGFIFLDNGASKLFNDITIDTSRYFINIIAGSIMNSHFRWTYGDRNHNNGIRVTTPLERKKTNKFLFKPVVISIIMDATGSMGSYITRSKECLVEMIKQCEERVKQDKLHVEVQYVAYRDICDMKSSSRMIEYHKLTNNWDSMKEFIQGIQATGGGDGPENIAAGFKQALKNLKQCSGYSNNHIFILVADAPNHHPGQISDDHPMVNEKNQEWKNVWLDIDNKMRKLKVAKLLCLSCQSYFDSQYGYWDQYGCTYLNSANVLEKRSLSSNLALFDNAYINDVADLVDTMYVE